NAETARRLGCDASVVGMIHDGEGNVLDVGRKSRTVPTRMRRALEARDRCCRFPGCRSTRTDAHHVEPWAAGGETSLENLALLCRRHHRRVHEDGWRLEGDPAGELRFLRPDGQKLPEVPPRLPPPEDPVGTLIREQSELEVDAWTATPDWDGTRMDTDWALSVLHPRAWDVEPEPEDPVSAETPGGGVSAETSGEGPRA
ncbi:MAG: HNH endonuclease signature motif containing protein, partial [Candidatus Palauibacterales bacterium]|nr:HNH endonuclease signature motif containing protein [Candidatus Palauibacterales bacterium]